MAYTLNVYAPLNAGINGVNMAYFPTGVGGTRIDLGTYPPMGTGTPAYTLAGADGVYGITPRMDTFVLPLPYQWVVNVDGNVTTYQDIHSFAYNPTGSETNVWIRVEMLGTGTTYSGTVVYNANGGIFATGSTTYTQTVTSTSTTTVGGVQYVTGATVTPGITRSGYAFLGWASSSGAAEALIVPGGNVSVAVNTTTYLYAVWAAGSTGGVVYIDGVKCVPYVYTNGGWQPCEAYAYSGGWNITKE